MALVFAAASRAAGQAPTAAPAKESAGALLALPDPAKPAPAEIRYAHPLYKALDAPPKLVDRPAPQDFETLTTLVLSLKLDESGQVADIVAVEPPLKGLATAAAPLVPKWRFQPAKKDGRAVKTWATYGVSLLVEAERAVVSSFSLLPVGATDPLPAVAVETAGDEWMARYPKEVSPRDETIVSIEDVDFLPVPEKTSWRFDATRLRSTVTALVEVSPAGTVARLVPTGPPVESFVVAWFRKMASAWRLSAGLAGGKPVASWMKLEATLDFNVVSAKEKGKRSIKKNLRASPAT